MRRRKNTTTELPLSKFWGDRVKTRRLQLGLTQTQLADLCNLTQQGIARIESGAVIPRDATKQRLAACLGTTPDDLFAWPEVAA